MASPSPQNSLLSNRSKTTKPWTVKWHVNRDFTLYCSTNKIQMANKKCAQEASYTYIHFL